MSKENHSLTCFRRFLLEKRGKFSLTESLNDHHETLTKAPSLSKFADLEKAIAILLPSKANIQIILM